MLYTISTLRKYLRSDAAGMKISSVILICCRFIVIPCGLSPKRLQRFIIGRAKVKIQFPEAQRMRLLSLQYLGQWHSLSAFESPVELSAFVSAYPQPRTIPVTRHNVAAFSCKKLRSPTSTAAPAICHAVTNMLLSSHPSLAPSNFPPHLFCLHLYSGKLASKCKSSKPGKSCNAAIACSRE